jgi:hypothetical protein
MSDGIMVVVTDEELIGFSETGEVPTNGDAPVP